MEFLGEDGTLLVPAATYETVTRENPFFDLKNTPCCVGYLSEYFRTQIPGVLRSMHATHSCCAVGKLAKEMVANHEKDITPVGENSPFAKLPKYGGKVLMLGCDPNRNTSMYGVQETTENIYCIDYENPVIYTLKNGENTMEIPSYLSPKAASELFKNTIV